MCFFRLLVSKGFAYRLRLINAIAIECPVVVSIDGHEITAIATDGRPVKPVRARSVQLYPGNVEINRYTHKVGPVMISLKQ